MSAIYQVYTITINFLGFPDYCGLYNAATSSYVANYIGSSSNSLLNIYTVNYNVLRVMSGMAGTAYSN